MPRAFCEKCETVFGPESASKQELKRAKVVHIKRKLLQKALRNKPVYGVTITLPRTSRRAIAISASLVSASG
jgi:hypothetical protein